MVAMGIWLEIYIFKVFIYSFQLLIKLGIKMAQPNPTITGQKRLCSQNVIMESQSVDEGNEVWGLS